MKTTKHTPYLIPLLFASGTFSLTAGVVAAVRNAPAETDEAIPSDEISQAIQTAQSWLSLIDAGQYEENYHQMDELIGKRKLSLSDWVKSCNSMKTDFGLITSRRYAKIDMLDEIPGLPTSSWMSVTFESETSAPLIREYIKASGTGIIPGTIAVSEGKLLETVQLIKHSKHGKWFPFGRILDIPNIHTPKEEQSPIPSHSLREQ